MYTKGSRVVFEWNKIGVDEAYAAHHKNVWDAFVAERKRIGRTCVCLVVCNTQFRSKALEALPPELGVIGRSIYEALTSTRFGCCSRKKSIFLENCDASQVRDALQVLPQRCTPDTQVIAVFISRGGRIRLGPKSGNYVLTSDTLWHAGPSSIASTAVSESFIAASMRALPCQKSLLCFDCHHRTPNDPVKASAFAAKVLRLKGDFPRKAAASCPSHIISSADPLAVEVPASLAKAARGKKGKNKGNSDGKTEEKPKGKAKEKTAEQEAEEKAASIAEGVLKRLGQSTHIAGADFALDFLEAITGGVCMYPLNKVNVWNNAASPDALAEANVVRWKQRMLKAFDAAVEEAKASLEDKDKLLRYGYEGLKQAVKEQKKASAREGLALRPHDHVLPPTMPTLRIKLRNKCMLLAEEGEELVKAAKVLSLHEVEAEPTAEELRQQQLDIEEEQAQRVRKHLKDLEPPAPRTISIDDLMCYLHDRYLRRKAIFDSVCGMPVAPSVLSDYAKKEIEFQAKEAMKKKKGKKGTPKAAAAAAASEAKEKEKEKEKSGGVETSGKEGGNEAKDDEGGKGKKGKRGSVKEDKKGKGEKEKRKEQAEGKEKGAKKGKGKSEGEDEDEGTGSGDEAAGSKDEGDIDETKPDDEDKGSETKKESKKKERKPKEGEEEGEDGSDEGSSGDDSFDTEDDSESGSSGDESEEGSSGSGSEEESEEGEKEDESQEETKEKENKKGKRKQEKTKGGSSKEKAKTAKGKDKAKGKGKGKEKPKGKGKTKSKGGLKGGKRPKDKGKNAEEEEKKEKEEKDEGKEEGAKGKGKKTKPTEDDGVKEADGGSKAAVEGTAAKEGEVKGEGAGSTSGGDGKPSSSTTEGMESKGGEEEGGAEESSEPRDAGGEGTARKEVAEAEGETEQAGKESADDAGNEEGKVKQTTDQSTEGGEESKGREEKEGKEEEEGKEAGKDEEGPSRPEVKTRRVSMLFHDGPKYDDNTQQAIQAEKDKRKERMSKLLNIIIGQEHKLGGPWKEYGMEPIDSALRENIHKLASKKSGGVLNSSHFFHVAPGNPSSFVVALAPAPLAPPSRPFLRSHTRTTITVQWCLSEPPHLPVLAYQLQMRGLGRANNYFRDLLLPPPRARAFMHHASHARGTAALNRLGECYSFSTQDSAYLLPHEAGFDERLHEPPPILEANEPGRPHMYAPVVPTSKKYKGPKKEVIRTPVDVPESLRNSVKATWSLHDIVHTVTAPTPHPPTVHRVNSLVPDSSYLFRVRALSAAGWSPWSEISDRLRTTQAEDLVDAALDAGPETVLRLVEDFPFNTDLHATVFNRLVLQITTRPQLREKVFFGLPPKPKPRTRKLEWKISSHTDPAIVAAKEEDKKRKEEEALQASIRLATGHGKKGDINTAAGEGEEEESSEEAVVEQYVKVVEGEQEYHSSRGMDDVPSIILKSLEQSPSDLKLQRAGLSLLTWLGEELPAKEGHTFQRQPGPLTKVSMQTKKAVIKVAAKASESHIYSDHLADMEQRLRYLLKIPKVVKTKAQLKEEEEKKRAENAEGNTNPV